MTVSIISFWYNYCHDDNDNDFQCIYHHSYMNFKVMLPVYRTLNISFGITKTVEAMRSEMGKAPRGSVCLKCLLTLPKHVPNDSRNKNSHILCTSHLTKPSIYISLLS